MKNFLLSIFLLSMSALASAQENVLSETWGQKLDLTIPSLEMQLISVLDSKDKQEIMMGWTCCYRKELINAVQTEHLWKSTELMSRANPRKLQYTLHEPITKSQMVTFVAFQLADIYTTYKGLQYECVREMNPLIGETPSVNRMFFTKVAILTPAIQYDLEKGNLTPRMMNEINFLMAMVIYNNHRVTRRASNNCQKRP